MTRPLYGADELRDWLASEGFRCAGDPLHHRDNECNWYGYRRSAIPARACECNSDKPGMQIVVKPSVITINGTRHSSAEVELCGEAGGEWWKLSAYGLRTEDVPAKLSGVEAALVAAWNALRAEP